MKFRSNSAKTSITSNFMILALNNNTVDSILQKEGIFPEDDYYCYYVIDDIINHKFAMSIDFIFSDFDTELDFVGKILTEDDLRKKTLNQLEIEFINELNKTYELDITIEDMFFDYGEVEG